MPGTNEIIRPLIAQDIPRVVEIFREQFPHLNWTRLGREFLQKFFRWHFLVHPELALVSEAENQVIGFIVGATGGHREYYWQVLRFAFPEFLSGSLLHPWLFLKPGFLRLWLDFLRGQLSTRTTPDKTRVGKTGEQKAIISFVAVTGSAQGRGVGARLKQAFERAAFQAGNAVLSSYTEINNYAARRLNEKCGWTQVREDTRHKMVYYSKRLDKNL
jgi:ribosomal protein S18 acetylase RimI-like enzyme